MHDVMLFVSVYKRQLQELPFRVRSGNINDRVVLPRNALMDMLYERIDRINSQPPSRTPVKPLKKRITLKYNTPCKGIEVTEKDKKIRVKTSVDEDQGWLEADFLIGSDGVNSSKCAAECRFTPLLHLSCQSIVFSFQSSGERVASNDGFQRKVFSS